MNKYRITSKEELLNLIIKYQLMGVDFKSILDNMSFIMSEFEELNNMSIHDSSYKSLYLVVENNVAQLVLHTNPIYGRIDIDLYNDITLNSTILVNLNRTFNDRSINSYIDFIVVNSADNMYELYNYKVNILDDVRAEVSFSIAKRVELKKRNKSIDLKNDIILAYYVDISGVSRDAAENLIKGVQRNLINKDNVYEIIIPVRNAPSKVECIFPKTCDDNVLELLDDINEKYRILLESK